MFERLIRHGAALLLSLFVLGAFAGSPTGAESGPASAGSAEIELRKSFRSSRDAGPQTVRSGNRGGGGSDTAAPDDARGTRPAQLATVAAALGEQLQSSGTLHLPGVGARGIVLQGSTTPILQTATGRQLIIDRDRTIAPGVVEGITRRWPAFVVVQPPAGAHLRDVLGSVLDAAGYESVVRSAPLIFGREVTIRFTPDFVVLQSERDLLLGETRAISVVDPAAALPAELRELAGEQRVRIVELAPDGTPVGVDRAPWRDPTGRVTTMASARLLPIIEEIAVAFGLSIERQVPLPVAAGKAGMTADLRISRAAAAVLVCDNSDPLAARRRVGLGDTAILLQSAADLPAGIGALLKRLGIPAIGPAIEFSPEPSPGSAGRFVLSVPGWLAESGGRRILITGTTPPLLVRLYLTREGIDIFEYRNR